MSKKEQWIVQGKMHIHLEGLDTLSTAEEANEPFDEPKMHRETLRPGLKSAEQQKSTDV